MKLNKITFEKLLAKAKHQLILKDGKFIYFIPVPKCISYSDTHFVANNETSKKIEIVNYKDIISCIIDGKKIVFDRADS